jgi:hypothetical protein
MLLASFPDLAPLLAYAGTAGPIYLNGLVRHYYLRGERL